MHPNRLDPGSLDVAELAALREVAATPGHLRLTNDRGASAEIPAALLRHFTYVLDLMSRGQVVSLISEDEHFTTQAAANYIGCSRQHFVDILERGEIPFERVGTHRRVKFRDLRAYRKRRDVERRAALNALAQRIEEAGFGDQVYLGDDDNG